MAKFQLKPHEKKSYLKGAIEKLQAGNTKANLAGKQCFSINLRHLDETQGGTLEDWQSTAVLSNAVRTLRGLCSDGLRVQAQNETFTIYQGFPPPEKTDYHHPEHVPEDAEWARIHVNGAHCLIGHVINDTFYLVFLDTTHTFWKGRRATEN